MFKLLAVSTLMLMLTSCGSSPVNEIKLSFADKVGEGVTGYSKKTLSDLPLSECSLEEREKESDMIGKDVRDKLDKLSKADRTQKSVAGDFLRSSCESALVKYIPSLLLQKYDRYKCHLKYGREKLANGAAKDVCKVIKL